MGKKQKTVDSKRYVTITNVDGTKAELLREDYEQSALTIQEILEDQKKCRGCNGTRCTQRDPYWVLLVRSGIDSRLSPAMSRCPLHGGRTISQAQQVQPTPADHSSLPALYQNVGFKDFQVTDNNRQAVNAIRSYLRKPAAPWMYLTGGPGTGKTFLACVAANELLRRGQKVHFEEADTLLDRLRQDVRQKNDAHLDLYREVPCLVLDNLGSKLESEWAAKQLSKILNNRYDRALPTLITSPYSMQELRAQLVPKGQEKNRECRQMAHMMVSRLAQCSTIHKLNGPDRRIRKQMERRRA